MPELDGVLSIGIGIVLTATAVFLARESKGLLIGEPAREPTRRPILKIAREHSGVGSVGRLIAVHLAPHQTVAIIDIDFADELSAAGVERAVNTLERQVRTNTLPALQRVLRRNVKSKAAINS